MIIAMQIFSKSLDTIGGNGLTSIEKVCVSSIEDMFCESSAAEDVDAMADMFCESSAAEDVDAMADMFCESSAAEEVDAMEASFCESSASEEISFSSQKSPKIKSLDSKQFITDALEVDSVENMHNNSFSLILEESSSDEMSNTESFDHFTSNVNLNPLTGNSETVCELSTCSDVADNIIVHQQSVSENNHGCISQNKSLNCENLQSVVSCGKSPIPKLTNTRNFFLKNEIVKKSASGQTNPVVGSEKMVSPTIAAVNNIKLDNNTERTSVPVTSHFQETVNTLVESNDGCETTATVYEDNMVEQDRMSETLPFKPCEESELIDLDLEFVPFGIPSPEECIMFQERSLISTHETQASILECPEQKCVASKNLERSGKKSIDHDQEKSFLPTTEITQEFHDSESVADQKSEEVGRINVDDHLVAECREEHNDSKSLSHEGIPNGKYCLNDHNLDFICNGWKIRLQFDIKDEFFTCPFCSVIALNDETIGQHIWNHTSDQELKCLLGCSDVFVTMKEMVDHLNSHKNNEVYRCGACQDTFPTVALIKSHVAILHEPNQFQNNTHENKIDQKFMCTKCGLSFGQENSLNMHHLGKCSSGFHSCSLCELSFQSTSQLTKHESSHYSQSPYRCTLCSFSSDNRCNLHFHLNEHRSNDRPYTCPACSMVCPNEASYMAHVLQLHCNGVLSCVCCNRTDFKRGNQLMRHMRAHEAHGWTENKVPGLRLFLSLQVMAAGRREGKQDDDDETITVTDCGGVRLQFLPDNYIMGNEQDLVSFEMDIV